MAEAKVVGRRFRRERLVEKIGKWGRRIEKKCMISKEDIYNEGQMRDGRGKCMEDLGPASANVRKITGNCRLKEEKMTGTVTMVKTTQL